jgi:hypothetical protein
MTQRALTSLIVENAAEIARLHRLVHEGHKRRDKSPEDLAAWQLACEEFHARYDALSFPGGYTGALDRISAGDPQAMEAAICFLELRPHFFRSGYMYKDILRRCKRAPLSQSQATRLAIVLEKLAAWKAHRAKD